MSDPIVEELNLELVDVEFRERRKRLVLTCLYRYTNGSIDIEQCAQVSEKLSEELDRTDPIPQNYFLEVSSPGAERPLKKEEDFEKAIGQFVFIKTYEPIDGA